MTTELPVGCGIYSIHNVVTGRTYVGSSRKLQRRCMQHISALASERHYIDALQTDWSELGAKAFEFMLLERTVDDDALLRAGEQRWMDHMVLHGVPLYCRPVASRKVPGLRRPLSRLLLVRRRALMTQQELSDRSGISRAAISAIEALKAEPEFSTIRKLAAALGCEPADLMEPEP